MARISSGTRRRIKQSGVDAKNKRITDSGLNPADFAQDGQQVKMTGDQLGTPISRDFVKGSNFGGNMIGEGSLGRLGESQDIQTALSGARELAGGFTGAQQQAQRDTASQNISQSTEQARRRLSAAQARSGVRGATAGAQQAGILGQGVQAQQGLERDLLLGQNAAQRQGVQDLAGLSSQVGQFDLGQAAREKFVPLSTGLSFAALGATERGSFRAAEAARAAGGGGGGKK